MKSRFTQIPNFIIFDKNITDAEFRTFTVLKSFKYKDGNVFPSQKLISELRGKSKRSIITHLKNLRINNHIQYKKRGYSASNQYHFISEDNYINDSKNVENHDTFKVKETSSQKLQMLHPNNTEIKNTEINNNVENKDDWELGRKRVEEIRRNMIHIFKAKMIDKEARK